MEQITNQEILERLNQVQVDISIIKEKLPQEEEITEYASEELEKARSEPREGYTSLQDNERWRDNYQMAMIVKNQKVNERLVWVTWFLAAGTLFLSGLTLFLSI